VDDLRAKFKTAVIECQTDDLNLKAPRPSYNVLGSRRGMLLRKPEGALRAFIEAYGSNFVEPAIACA